MHKGQEAEVGRSYWERHVQLYDLTLRVLAKPAPRMIELAVTAVAGANNVLEVGAGTGLLTMPLAQTVNQHTATDYADGMVEKLRARLAAAGVTNVRCEQADLYALPYEAAAFDAVVAANVLHLVPDLSRALAALRRVVRPQGLVVVPTFCHGQTTTSRLLSAMFSVTGFPAQRQFTSSSLRNALAGEGLRIGHCELIAGPVPITYVHGTFEH